jgi:hypothetical protein
MSQSRLRNHVISLPSDGPEMISSFADSLPRNDLPKYAGLAFLGKDKNAQTAFKLNSKRIRFEFKPTIQVLKYLKDVSPAYADVKIAETPEEVNWKKQRDDMFGDDSVISSNDDLALRLDNAVQSDIAKVWESSSVLPDSENDDSIPKTVMLTSSSGYVNNDQLVLSAVEKQLELEEEEKDVQVTLDEVVPDFFRSHEILSGGFPFLFPRGVPPSKMKKKMGGFYEPIKQMLLCLCDDRFATNVQFLFYLANLEIRMLASQQVGVKLHGDDPRVKSFFKIVNQPGFKERLRHCIEHPKSKEAKKLMNEILPIKIVGKRMPWSAMERQQTLPELYAMFQRLSVPYMFVTISPKIIENELCLCFAAAQDGMADPIELKLNSKLVQRAILLSKNPIASCRTFEIIVQAYFEIMLGYPSTTATKIAHQIIRGYFGLPSGGWSS